MTNHRRDPRRLLVMLAGLAAIAAPLLPWYHRHLAPGPGRGGASSVGISGWHEDVAVSTLIVLYALVAMAFALRARREWTLAAALFVLGLAIVIFAGYRVGTLPPNHPPVSYHRAAGESLAALATVLIAAEAFLVALAGAPQRRPRAA